MRILTLALNGFRGMQGFRGLQGYQMGNTNVTDGWNSLFTPDRFSQKELGGNWIDPDLLGPLGVGDLNISGIVWADNTLDNRHIPEALHSMLCGHGISDNETAAFREYFSVLIELAWPRNAELRVCCSEAAGWSATAECLTPDHTFSSNTPEMEGFEPPAFAPHFLTEMFEARQQEALTAMLIPKINVLGKHLELDIHGILDLGPAGTRFMAGKEPGFDYYLGSSWGNAFLDCYGRDADHVLCQASREEDRDIGRNPFYFGLPMFACNGGSDYPTRESGKACFSTDMATNERDGCEMVASVGTCDRVCVAGFCGANDPPLEDRGTTNVLSIYMRAYNGEDDFRHPNQQQQADSTVALKIALPILLVLLVAFAALVLWKGWKAKNADKAVSSQKESSTTAESDTDGDDPDDTDGESV